MNTKKTILLLAILSMVLVSFSGIDSAGESESNEQITYSGTVDLINGDVPYELSSVMSWNVGNKILTMENANVAFTGNGTSIIVPNSTKIMLIGNNSLVFKGIGIACINALSTFDDFSIEGKNNASLSLNGNESYDFGICVKNLDVKNCNLDIHATVAISSMNGGGYNEYFPGNYSFTNVNLVVDNTQYCFVLTASVIFDRCNVDITTNNGVFLTQYLEIPPKATFVNCANTAGMTKEGKEPFTNDNIAKYIGLECTVAEEKNNSDPTISIILFFSGVGMVGLVAWCIASKY